VICPGRRAFPIHEPYACGGRVAQLLRGGSWNHNPRNCRSAYRNHNQPDNANNNVGFRVVCLPQHPSSSEPLEGIPTGVQEGSRPAPEISCPGALIRTAPGGAPPAHGLAIGAGSAPLFSPQP
jgi:hypothetical protein